MSFGYDPAEKGIYGGWCQVGRWTGASTPPTTFYDIGDIYDLEVEPKVTTTPTYTLRFGLKYKDNDFVTASEMSLKFKLSQKNKDVLAMAVLGSINGLTVLPMTDVTQYFEFRFFSVPAQTSDKVYDEKYWKVKVTPTGARMLLSENLAAYEFQGEILADLVNHPQSASVSPFGVITEADASTPAPTE